MRVLLMTLTLMTSLAMANEAQLNWTAPTERTDGTTL